MALSNSSIIRSSIHRAAQCGRRMPPWYSRWYAMPAASWPRSTPCSRPGLRFAHEYLGTTATDPFRIADPKFMQCVRASAFHPTVQANNFMAAQNHYATSALLSPHVELRPGHPGHGEPERASALSSARSRIERRRRVVSSGLRAEFVVRCFLLTEAASRTGTCVKGRPLLRGRRPMQLCYAGRPRC